MSESKTVAEFHSKVDRFIDHHQLSMEGRERLLDIVNEALAMYSPDPQTIVVPLTRQNLADLNDGRTVAHAGPIEIKIRPLGEAEPPV